MTTMPDSTVNTKSSPQQVFHDLESLLVAFPHHVTTDLLSCFKQRDFVPEGSSNTFIALSWEDMDGWGGHRHCLDSLVQLCHRKDPGLEDTLRLSWYCRPSAFRGNWTVIDTDATEASKTETKRLGTKHFQYGKTISSKCMWEQTAGTSLARPQRVYTRLLLDDASDMLVQSLTGERDLERDRREFERIQSELLDGETSASGSSGGETFTLQSHGGEATNTESNWNLVETQSSESQ